MRRLAVSITLALLALLAPLACAKRAELGGPLKGLTSEQRDRFVRGRAEFARAFVPETGLGPLFNADSCAECHEDPVPGGPGDEVEVHVAVLDPQSGFCDPLVEHGGPVIQQAVTPALRAALGIESEPIPEAATVRAGRSSPDILGFGLLDAVTDEAILARSDPDDEDRDGISGRPNRFFDGRIGRFGRKALVPTLREFNTGAFPVEQGVTDPAAPTEESIGGKPIPAGVDPLPEPEIAQETVDLTDAFVRFSAPPPPRALRGAAKRGRDLFARIGCADCHVPTLTTGPSHVEALNRKPVHAYTDLLLHDMGPELADICLGEASPSEFRTEPLMGLGLSEIFLHDGRARSPEEAVRLHGGEALASRSRFEGLPQDEREALIEFLESL